MSFKMSVIGEYACIISSIAAAHTHCVGCEICFQALAVENILKRFRLLLRSRLAEKNFTLIVNENRCSKECNKLTTSLKMQS